MNEENEKLEIFFDNPELNYDDLNYEDYENQKEKLENDLLKLNSCNSMALYKKLKGLVDKKILPNVENLKEKNDILYNEMDEVMEEVSKTQYSELDESVLNGIAQIILRSVKISNNINSIDEIVKNI